MIDKAGNQNLLLASVDKIIPKDNEITLENIFSQRKTVRAKILKMALVEHKIILLEL
jgi:predicted RNA-binding protein